MNRGLPGSPTREPLCGPRLGDSSAPSLFSVALSSPSLCRRNSTVSPHTGRGSALRLPAWCLESPPSQGRRAWHPPTEGRTGEQKCLEPAQTHGSARDAAAGHVRARACQTFAPPQTRWGDDTPSEMCLSREVTEPLLCRRLGVMLTFLSTSCGTALDPLHKASSLILAAMHRAGMIVAPSGKQEERTDVPLLLSLPVMRRISSPLFSKKRDSC